MKKTFVALLIVFMMCMPYMSVHASESDVGSMETQMSVPYTVDNSFQVVVTVPEKTVFTAESFPEVSCSDVFVASMKKVGEGYSYTLILVFDDADEGLDVASEREKIMNNSLVKGTANNEFVTRLSYVELSDYSITLNVGESAEVSVLDAYLNGVEIAGVFVSFDPEVHDTTAIPNKMIQEYGFAKFMTQEEAWRTGNLLGVYPDVRLGDQYCFGVMETEEATETEEYIDIISKLSTVHGVEEVYLYYKQPYPTGNPPYEEWDVENSEIASFVLAGGELAPGFTAGRYLKQTATITGLKVGTTNITATRTEFGAEAQASCKITVVAPDFIIEDSVLISYVGNDEVVVIPEGVTVIGDSAFANNTMIKSVTVPEGVIKIGEKAFQGCTNLSELNLPDSLTRIGFAALDGCEKLERLVLPVGIQTMYTCIFADVERMEYHTPGPEYAYFKESAIKELVIMNPRFVEFTEETEHSPWGPDPMSAWADCLVNLEKVYGYTDCDAEKIKPSCFIPLEEGLENVARNYSNEPQYVGDINNDCAVTAEDALMILRHVVKLTELITPENADVDGVEGINAADALQVLRYVVKLDEKVTYKPKAFETHQFTVNAKFQQLDPNVVNETVIIENKGDLDAFLDSVYEKYYTEHNEEDFEAVKAHFASLDDAYFEENVCVITVDAGKLEWGKYRANTLTNRDTIVDGETVAKRGLVLNYYVGADTPVDGIAEYATYILVSGTTISRESLDGAELDYVTFRTKSAEKF